MSSRDHLVKQVGGLLIQRQIAQFVADQKCRIGIDLELANQRVISLGCDQLIEHLHGRGKENAQIGLACLPSDNLRQKGFSGSGRNSHIMHIILKPSRSITVGTPYTASH